MESKKRKIPIVEYGKTADEVFQRKLDRANELVKNMTISDEMKQKILKKKKPD